LTIFGEKIGIFLKNQRYDQIFAKSSSSLSKKVPKVFGEKIFKIGPSSLVTFLNASQK
jgi:hypothetical protein